MIIFIYALVDPITTEIRYIGKTADLSTRLRAHINDAKTGNNHRDNWVKKLCNQNLRPDLVILQEVTEDTWEIAERAWIRYGWEQGWRLTNSTEGGEGAYGRKLSAESINKMSNAARGNSSHRDKLHSAESKKRMSDATKGKVLSVEHRQKIRLAGTGLRRSDESRKRISLAKQGSKHPSAKLTEEDVRNILQLCKSARTDSEIAEKYGVSRTTVYGIRLRKRWRHVNVE